MTANEPPGRPARRPLPRIPLAAAAGAALVVGIVGYAIGHSQGASRNTATPKPSSACAAVNDALTRQEATAQSAPANTDAQRTVANLVIQNRDCFDAQLVATAQTLLDKLNQGATADAICAASGQPWWKC